MPKIEIRTAATSVNDCEFHRQASQQIECEDETAQRSERCKVEKIVEVGTGRLFGSPCAVCRSLRWLTRDARSHKCSTSRRSLKSQRFVSRRQGLKVLRAVRINKMHRHILRAIPSYAVGQVVRHVPKIEVQEIVRHVPKIEADLGSHAFHS